MNENRVLTKEEYNKRIKRCEKLGARKFAKIVKVVEKAKFKILKTVFPSYVTKANKFIDRRQQKLLNKCKTDEERQAVIEQCRMQKMLNKREDNYEMNRNYHLFRNRFSELINYLHYNKDVHKRGLIMDSIALPILTGLSFVNPIFIPFAVFSGVSLAVNFQCVNLQNYNLYRLEKNKDVITRKERQTIRQTQENYTDGVKIINKVIDSDKKELSAEERLKAIETRKEELIKMRELIIKEQERRSGSLAKQNVKKIGGV